MERVDSTDSQKRRGGRKGLGGAVDDGSISPRTISSPQMVQRQNSSGIGAPSPAMTARENKRRSGGVGSFVTSAADDAGFGADAVSTRSSLTEMKRDVSSGGSSVQSDVFVPMTSSRYQPLPLEDLPSHRILSRLDSFLGDDSIDSGTGTAVSPLDAPPRKLILHAPVLQVVNANTVKDRYLFLFSDLLLITKPIIYDDAQGEPVPPTLDTSFIIKSVVELKQIKVLAAQDATSSASSDKRRSQSGFAAFVDRFANDPKKAIGSLVQRGGMPNDAGAIAQMRE